MEKVKPIHRLTLFDMFKYPELYSGLAEGLTELPLPDILKIGKKEFTIPEDMAELSRKICYGQRQYLARKEDNDFGIIIRCIGGYYYPEYFNTEWDDEKVCIFSEKILPCKVIEAYPVSLHLVTLLSELVINEQKLLHREPSKIELAAGIEKLDVFAELNVLDFLRDAMKCTVKEVLLTPYNECLVRLLNAKEIMDYQERYYKLQAEELEIKSKKR